MRNAQIGILELAFEARKLGYLGWEYSEQGDDLGVEMSKQRVGRAEVAGERGEVEL